MRQPASLSKARPRQDHQLYGPATSGCTLRTTSTQPDSMSSVSHRRSEGREAGLLDVGLPRLDVGLGMGDVPVAADHRLAVVGGQLGHPLAQRSHEAFLLHLPLGAGLAGVHVDAAHRDRTGRASTSTSTYRPWSANSVAAKPIRISVNGVRLSTATPHRPWCSGHAEARCQPSAKAGARASASCPSSARVSCRHTASALGSATASAADPDSPGTARAPPRGCR